MGFFANLITDPYKPSNGKWLFVGDSQTNKMATNYVAQLKNSVGFTNFKIVQKDGATTDWILAELKKELASNPTYDYVVVWGGYNDMYGRVLPERARVTAIANIKQMVSLIRAGKGAFGLPRKAIVVNLHCDSLRAESARFANNEAQTSLLYADILKSGANYVVPTRAITGGCPKDLNALKTNRATYCTKGDPICHLNSVGNKAIATNIAQKLKWI
jgi:lysophospholipase L1-like esterase